MNSVLDTIINWSEVWSLVIPLVVILLHKPKGDHIKPIVLYVCFALVVNSIAMIIVEFYFSIPVWARNNNILYNLHSFIRVLFFSLYIIRVREYRFAFILKSLLAAYFVFMAINFAFFDDIFLLSSRLFVAESIVLLALCLSFFFRSMQDDSETNWLKHPAFLVCTGICLYAATSFIIFLFFYPLVTTNKSFADIIMSLHNVMYLILCVLLAAALYRSRKRQAVTGKA